ncbi:MAG: regulatory protein RecX [Bacteroidia bacterium]
MDHEILKRLYKYCAYQDRCKSEVQQKLSEWDSPSEDWDLYLTHLEKERFLDENRYTHSFVRGKFFIKKWGKQKIKQALRRKSIPNSLIEETINQEIDAETYSATLQKLVQQKLTQYHNLDEQTQKEKIFRFLMQKGFEYAEIQNAWEDRVL